MPFPLLAPSERSRRLLSESGRQLRARAEPAKALLAIAGKEFKSATESNLSFRLPTFGRLESSGQRSHTYCFSPPPESLIDRTIDFAAERNPTDPAKDQVNDLKLIRPEVEPAPSNGNGTGKNR